jgi:hypothetical protein
LFAERLASRTRLGLAVAVALTTACAPDAWRSDPAFDRWTTRVTRECYPRAIGSVQLSDRFAQPAFLDLTSRLYAREIGVQQYRDAIDGFYPGDNKGALDCIVAKLPPLVSPTMR